MKKYSNLINIILIVLTFIGSYFAYLNLPAEVASHWNTQGEVDGYMSRFGGAFFLPFLLLALYILFLILPKIDPKKNILKFKGIYFNFITVFILYMIYIHALTLIFNLGFTFDFTRATIPAFAILFYFIGWMLPRAKPNWFVGVRTPWTLSSDIVWTKTHELGGKLYKASAIVALLGFVFPLISFYLIIVPILASSIFIVAFSYFEYKKIEK